jgi:hypothetical protein
VNYLLLVSNGRVKCRISGRRWRNASGERENGPNQVTSSALLFLREKSEGGKQIKVDNLKKSQLVLLVKFCDEPE